MRDLCACIHERTIARVSRAFYAILAHNVGIVRETCRAEGKTCYTRGAGGCDVQGMLILCYRSRQVAMAEEELLDLACESLVKDQDPDRAMRWKVVNASPGNTFLSINHNRLICYCILKWMLTIN